MPKAKKKIPWADSQAKEQLFRDIVAEKVTEDMKPRVVFAMHPELYSEYKKGFGSNYRNLQEAIAKEQAHADQDRNFIEHDLALHPPAPFDGRGHPRWCGSEAERLLMQDIQDGVHKTMKPADLVQSRPEYARGCTLKTSFAITSTKSLARSAVETTGCLALRPRNKDAERGDGRDRPNNLQAS